VTRRSDPTNDFRARRAEQEARANELPISVLYAALRRKAREQKRSNPDWWHDGQAVIITGRVVAPKVLRSVVFEGQGDDLGTRAKLSVESSRHPISIRHTGAPDEKILRRLRGFTVRVEGHAYRKSRWDPPWVWVDKLAVLERPVSKQRAITSAPENPRPTASPESERSAA
jgi:hypothetical protein